MTYALCLALILVGLYGVLVKRNAVKIVISLLVIEYGIHLFLAMVGYRHGGAAPIVEAGADPAEWARRAVDPLPQALVLTSIVIGLGVLSLMVALSVRLQERYGTFDLRRIRKLRG